MTLNLKYCGFGIFLKTFLGQWFGLELDFVLDVIYRIPESRNTVEHTACGFPEVIPTVSFCCAYVLVYLPKIH